MSNGDDSLVNFKAGPIDIMVGGDQAAMQAIAGNQPFPQWDTKLGELTAKAATADPIRLPSSGGVLVQFSGNVSAYAGLGLFTDPAKLVNSLGIADDLSAGLTLSGGNDSGFCVLRWGYDLAASAQGSVALAAPGSLTFGVDGSREAVYAVVRRFNRAVGGRDVIQGTVASWTMPQAVKSVEDLQSATWLIAEVDGAIALKIAGAYGYDFDWVRQLKAGGLSGDVGLKLHAAISVALGFSAAGKYCVVLSREPEDPQNLRLRIFKSNKKGWSFSFNGGATANAVNEKFLPETFNDFVKAVFGTHGQQILKDLEAIDQWTDPSQALSKQLANLGVDYFQKFIEKVTGIDPQVAFNAARTQLLDLLKKWDALPAKVASTLWSHVPNTGSLGEISKIANDVATLNQDSLKALLSEHLQNVKFFETPAGQWLETAAAGRLVAALTGTREFQQLKDVAATTASLLDGAKLQQALTTLQQELDRRLDLNQIETAVSATNLAAVDVWLKAKLAALLGPINGIADLQKARALIRALEKQGPAIYEKGVKALNKTYSFAVSSVYQSSRMDTALVDASFDLTQAAAAERFRDLLKGNYDEFLIRDASGVTLHSGSLTHNVQRSWHVEVSLPFYSSTIDEITNSLARVSAVDEVDGRVLIYELQADNEVTTRNRRDSRLAIAAFYPAADVRKYGAPAMSCNYTYVFQQAQMKRAALVWQSKPYIDAYFPQVFHSNSAASGSLSEWIGDVDKYVDAQLHNGTDNVGDTRISLEVSLPSDVASFWLRLDPAKVKGRLGEMSRGLQAALRGLLLSYHFADVRHYSNLGAAAPLIVYAALPITTGVKSDGGRLTFNDDSQQYWDYADRSFRKMMIRDGHTTANLVRLLSGISEVISSVPELKSSRAFYTPENAVGFQETVVNFTGAQEFPLFSLLRTESILIDGATKAAKEMLDFNKAKDKQQPAKAIQILTRFGEEATRTFNGLGEYTGDVIRPLGPLLISTMAQVLCPELNATQPAAMFTVSVMKNGVALPQLADVIKADDAALAQRIASL